MSHYTLLLIHTSRELQLPHKKASGRLADLISLDTENLRHMANLILLHTRISRVMSDHTLLYKYTVIHCV